MSIVSAGFLSGHAQVVIPSSTEPLQVQTCWESTAGLRYQIQVQNSPDPTWVDLGDPITATEAETCVADSYASGRSYRVVLIIETAPDSTAPPEMAWINPGTFLWGTPLTELCRNVNEGPQTLATITRGFWMDKYEVTQAKYLEVVGVNPSYHVGDLRRPVEMVRWVDATNYCHLLTRREREAGRLPEGYVYRLATETEWEYACRAGNTGPFGLGNGQEMRSGMANFDGRREYPPCPPNTFYCANPSGVMLYSPQPVGRYAANAWGLHDMHGNVWEWVWDWNSSRLPGGSVVDYQGGPQTWGRGVKGGRPWVDSDYSLRSGWRGKHDPIAARNELGFRAVLAPPL